MPGVVPYLETVRLSVAVPVKMKVSRKKLSSKTPTARTRTKTRRARSLTEIAEKLAARGYKTKDGKPLSSAQVKRLITYLAWHCSRR